MQAQRGVLLGAAAGLGFGVSDVAIKALSGGVLSNLPWVLVAALAAVASFYASARSLQVGEGVSVIAVTSVAANMSAILAGVIVFGDPMGKRRARGDRPHGGVRDGPRRCSADASARPRRRGRQRAARPDRPAVLARHGGRLGGASKAPLPAWRATSQGRAAVRPRIPSTRAAASITRITRRATIRAAETLRAQGPIPR
jgi:hypothetical protein